MARAKHASLLAIAINAKIRFQNLVPLLVVAGSGTLPISLLLLLLKFKSSCMEILCKSRCLSPLSVCAPPRAGWQVAKVGVRGCWGHKSQSGHGTQPCCGCWRSLSLLQQWYTSSMSVVCTWLTDRMDLQLHIYQLKTLIRIVKVSTSAQCGCACLPVARALRHTHWQIN